jgi:hypothetical protein
VSHNGTFLKHRKFVHESSIAHTLTVPRFTELRRIVAPDTIEANEISSG